MDSFAPEVAGLFTQAIALAVVISALAGVIRGITGFGGALVMSPPLALLLMIVVSLGILAA